MNDQTRRWVIAVAAGAAAAVLLAACGNNLPEGVDGQVANEWSGLTEPVRFEPEPQVCHQEDYGSSASLPEYQPVGCDQPHLTETIHVGTFGGAAADLDAPPTTETGPERRAHGTAYRQCEKQAKEYLGGDFRRGRLWLGVTTPSESAWQGGARWFRCELMEIESVYGGAVERDAPLTQALAGDSDLRLGCYQVEADGGEVSAMTPVGCGQAHAAEFVGVWRAPGGTYPDGDAQSTVYDGCRGRVAAYADVPADDDLIYRTGTIADWMSKEDWRAGDRAFRCYLWLPGRELTESLAGAGDDALPIQTE